MVKILTYLFVLSKTFTRATFLVWVGGWLLSACVERIELDESLAGASLLVVDGGVTDAAGPYEVTLSYTSPTLEAYRGEVLSGAEVYIADEEENRANLTETPEDPGTYRTDSASFRGAVGRTYTLHIITPDGQTYASRPETMLPVAPIDSIYFELESRPRVSAIGTLSDEWGLQFYVKTRGGDDKASYYRWRWTETFQFTAPLTLPMQLSTPICYQSVGSARFINIATTEGLRRNRIEQQPLNFVVKAGRKLLTRYSLLVQQHSLTERAYTFWENIRAQQEEAGSVFAPPPSPIAGNVYRVEDEREVVLGYFQASAVTEQRIFVTRSQVPAEPGGNPNGFAECGPGTSEPSDYCYDCTLISGTTTEPPSFW